LAKKQDQFFIVNIPTVSNNYDKELETCLEDFVGESSIQWPCLKCTTNEEDVASTLSIQFTKLPKILIIRLKTSVQHNASISYSHKINLEKYYKRLDSEEESTEFNLIGVICHFGTVSGGHC
jgi:ubiquitin C-terminal hydrolase